MSDGSQFVSESLEELLVAIAEGVTEAQQALSSAPPFDAFGRPLPTYHLPYLDFDLKVDMQTVESSSGVRSLKILTLGGSNKSQNQSISSSLSGRFVAIPPGDGLPLPVLQLDSILQESGTHLIKVKVTNTAGELLQNARVEINLNLPLSKTLSSGTGVNLNNLGNSQLAQAILITDEQGQASTELTVDNALPTKASIVISAEYDQRISNIVVAVGSSV